MMSTSPVRSPLAFTLASRGSLTVLATVLFTACGAEDGSSGAADPSLGDISSTDDPTGDESAGDVATGDTPDASTGDATSSSTGALAPCDACDGDASCVDDMCVCDDGFAGDGAHCEDIDECAGKHDCAVDAACSNTPGGYDCTCGDGYKGNGFTCADIDECNEELDDCSENADCTNQDGGFKCACHDGFTGNGVTCEGSKEFGETCDAHEDCASGICVPEGPAMCTRTCTQDVANDCGNQGLTGLCVPYFQDLFVCVGDLTFGDDQDDEILKSGDKVTRAFQSTTDADLFLFDIQQAGDYRITATPDPDDDLLVEFYSGWNGAQLGVIDEWYAGGYESVVVTDLVAGSVVFAVVRNIGATNGSFAIEIIEQ